MPELLTGRAVLVTGGTSGIGRAAAVALARAGARVAVAGRRAAEGEETVRSVAAAGGEAAFIQADVTRPEEVKAMVERAAGQWGRLDVAFNNAGITGEMASTADCSEENWERTIRVNLTAVWYCMKSEIAEMLKRGGGVIVNNASVAGLVGMRGGPAYSASKGGVIQLTRTAALEYAKCGIRVNAVCPGFIETPMTEAHTSSNPDLEPWIRRIQPMGRLGTAKEVAQAVVWLCSDAASFVTGHALTIDGGMTAQ
jgi:NAD(P)-dependent dehydrogenase (short-subunit alcohol dehydrogenase family)